MGQMGLVWHFRAYRARISLHYRIGRHMARTLAILISIYCLALGAYMWLAPQYWYDATPGVAMMGPFNLHFIRDAALAFLSSGAALMWGALKRNRAVAVFGALWIGLHAAFHIWIWTQRGFALDQVAFVNLIGIQLPAWTALLASSRIKKRAFF